MKQYQVVATRQAGIQFIQSVHNCQADNAWLALRMTRQLLNQECKNSPYTFKVYGGNAPIVTNSLDF